MNIGGTVRRDGLAFTMVNAEHSSAIIKDGVPVTMGDPAGFVIKGEGTASITPATPRSSPTWR